MPPDPSDDPSISDDDTLYRRLHPNWILRDKNTQVDRITSAAFQNRPDTNAVSVYLEAECGGVDAVIEGHSGYGVASLQSGLARAQGQGITRVPEGTAGHAHIVGDKPKRIQKALSKGATIVLAPLSP